MPVIESGSPAPVAPAAPAGLSSRILRAGTLVLLATSLSLAIGSAIASAQAGAGDAAKGKLMFDKLCVTCHGAQAQGNKALGAPALWQQESWYLVAQLEKFKSGARGSHAKDTGGAQMRPMAAQLTDALADRGGAGEAHLADETLGQRHLEARRGGRAVRVDDLQDPFGQPGVEEQGRERVGQSRRVLGRLQDNGVSHRERRGNLLHRLRHRLY